MHPRQSRISFNLLSVYSLLNIAISYKVVTILRLLHSWLKKRRSYSLWGLMCVSIPFTHNVYVRKYACTYVYTFITYSCMGWIFIWPILKTRRESNTLLINKSHLNIYDYYFVELLITAFTFWVCTWLWIIRIMGWTKFISRLFADSNNLHFYHPKLLYNLRYWDRSLNVRCALWDRKAWKLDCVIIKAIHIQLFYLW